MCSFEGYFQSSLFLNTFYPNQIGIHVEIVRIACFPFTCKCSDSLLQGKSIVKAGHSEQSWSNYKPCDVDMWIYTTQHVQGTQHADLPCDGTDDCQVIKAEFKGFYKGPVS